MKGMCFDLVLLFLVVLQALDSGIHRLDDFPDLSTRGLLPSHSNISTLICALTDCHD